MVAIKPISREFVSGAPQSVPTTDDNGNASFGPLSLGPVPAGQTVFTATNNTSEFSECRSAATNSAPTATDDSYTTNQDTTLNQPAPGVLANDSDSDGDSLTAIQVSGPANGQLSLNPDGSFTYTPNAGFSGSDSFTYKVNDGSADSNPATVTVTVNHAPVAVDDSATTDEDTAAVMDVLSNDTDADGNSLNVVGSSLSTPAHGKVELITTSGTDKGKVRYTPNANYNGPDSFKYRASDGSAESNVATVNITVRPSNDAPVAQDDSYNVNENTQLQVSTPGVLGNDADADSDTLTAVQATGPANGQLTLNADGSFIYTPDANFSGTDSFTYKANDGSADSNIATVKITVNHVDTTAPTIVSVNPPDKQTGVSTTTNITITFSEKMDPNTLIGKTITLVKPGKKPTSIPVTMTNKTDSSGRTVLTLDPYGTTAQKLAGNTTYQLTIEGAGDTDGLAVRDSAGNELAKDYVSSFTTARK